MNMLNVSSSPHVRDKDNTRSIMMDVCIAMLPTAAYGVVQVGISAALVIIVTVAAAVLSDLFAEKVDFFSIGTNDLTQYALALDRVNPHLKEQFDPHHRSVTRLIKLIADNAHKAGIPVGICGELARDEVLLPFFMKVGIDELSVSPAYTLQLRKRISEIDTTLVNLEDFI